MPVTGKDMPRPDPRGPLKEWLYYCEGMYYYKDFLCMPDCTPEVMKWVEEELTFQEGDVIVVAYPAAGISWLQEVVWHLSGHMDMIEKEKKQDLGTRVNFMEHEHWGLPPWHYLKDRPLGTRTFKSHLPAHYLRERVLQGKVKVIHWVMNPRNNLVKYHHLIQTKGKHLNFPKVEWNTFYEMFKAHQLCEGDWFDMTLSWLSLVELPNVLTLRYDEVAANKEASVAKIAEFMGRKVSPEDVKRLVNVEAFDKAMDPSAKFSTEQTEEFNRIFEEKMKGTYLDIDEYRS